MNPPSDDAHRLIGLESLLRRMHRCRTPQEAVENSPAAGLPEGVLTMAPDAGKGPAQVWVVDPGSNEILASVSVFRGLDGWFVDGVMTCS